jgi:hypothetical protein
MKEDMGLQLMKLRKYDAFFEAGHQVSYFDFSGLEVTTYNENTFKQIPWAKTLFIITTPSALYIFNSITEQVTLQHKFEELLPEEATVMFDIQGRKVGLVITGHTQLFEYDNETLKHQCVHKVGLPPPSPFNPRVRYRREFPWLLSGDNLISVDSEGEIEWRSLKDNEQVTLLRVGLDYNNFEFAASKVEPVLYACETIQYHHIYRVWQIDCTLQSDPPLTLLYKKSLGAYFENCSDDTQNFNIVENEHGRILQVPQLGAGDRAFNAYDLDRGRMIANLHFDDGYLDHEQIQFNTGAPSCCLTIDDTLVIRDVRKDYEDESDDAAPESEEEMQVAYNHDSIEDYAFYSRVFKFGLYQMAEQWLNDDILTFKIWKRSATNKRITSRVFFSIAQRRVIGTIDDQIVELFMNGNQIIAFHSSGSIYRITLHPSYKTSWDDTVDEDDVLCEDMLAGTKKRKREGRYHRFDSYEEDFEPPSRKRLRSSLAEEIKK